MALALVFAAPGFLAIAFYLNPSWLSALPTNRGAFIQPPAQLNVFGDAEDKWRLTLWCPAGCEDTACLNTLDELARVRLALGRRLYQVDLWFLQGEKSKACTQADVQALASHDVHVKTLSTEQQADVPVLQDEATVFMVDPEQYFVLQYASSQPSKDVFQDLKRLINTREQA